MEKIIMINRVFSKLAPLPSDDVELGNLHVNLRCSETEGKRVGGALRMGPYTGRLVYLKRGRKTPADRLSEAER